MSGHNLSFIFLYLFDAAVHFRCLEGDRVVLTSLFRASVAVPLISGSIDRSVSRSDRVDGGTSLNFSARHR